MYLILSTLPHLLSIIPLIKYYFTYTFGYCNIIILSTLFSSLYHYHQEANHIITMIDYFFAYYWFAYDVYMGYTYTNDLTRIIFANFVSFIINTQIPYNKFYVRNHSIWHIINSSKCIYISTLLRNHLHKTYDKTL